MPTRPPRIRARPAAKQTNWTKRASRHQRGYGSAHDRMRKLVLREEPLCRPCLEADPQRIRRSTIADHVVPKAEGGTDERDNYQGICDPCHVAKTAAEAARARTRNAG